MQYANFQSYFDTFAYPKLAHRAESFKYAFKHLSSLDRPACIVETGCVRNAETWDGEGQSTLLFDNFSKYNPGTIVHSVDISSHSTDLCKSLVSDRVQVHTMDSVLFLKKLCPVLLAPGQTVDLLYLDSYDVDLEDPHPSALHHMNELLAASPIITSSTLILVDDSPTVASYFMDGGFIRFASAQRISGKGKYIASYMNSIGNVPVIQSYQAAWFGI